MSHSNLLHCNKKEDILEMPEIADIYEFWWRCGPLQVLLIHKHSEGTFSHSCAVTAGDALYRLGPVVHTHAHSETSRAALSSSVACHVYCTCRQYVHVYCTNANSNTLCYGDKQGRVELLCNYSIILCIILLILSYKINKMSSVLHINKVICEKKK